MRDDPLKFTGYWEEPAPDDPADETYDCLECDGKGCEVCQNGTVDIDTYNRQRARLRAIEEK